MAIMTTGFSPPTSFTVPKNGEIFISNIEERSRDLIASTIWSGLEATTLRIWLNNFSTDRERYFASCILDSLIYRSPFQTNALMAQLFQRTLPDLHRNIAIPDISPNKWLQHLREHDSAKYPKIRVVPVIRIDDPPTKSGPMLARMYKHRLGINEKLMIWPWQIDEAVAAGVRVFLFVDDFLGTGTQFSRFAKHFKMEEKLKDACAIYCPLTAHTIGIQKLKKDCQWLHVCSAETLTDADGLFTDTEDRFCDGINSATAARKFYHSILRKRSIRIDRTYINGFGNLSLTYVFEHATPNNCLPLLWYSHKRWTPLFRR